MKRGKLKKMGMLLLVLAFAFIFAACGSEAQQEDAGQDMTTIKVGATPVPHAEILEFVKPMLEENGIDLEIVVFTDYVTPNTALSEGELDANFFQHLPYLEKFNDEHGTDLAYTVAVHFEPLGIYSKKISSLEEIPDGAKIGVPNDPTNEARALLLLETNGLIKLKEDAGLNATKLDIVENPKNVEIVEMEAAQLSRALEDLDLAIINGNYALDAGLTMKDALAAEAKDSLAAQTFGNVLAIRAGEENRPEIQALSEALNSDEVRQFIEEKYAESGFLPVF